MRASRSLCRTSSPGVLHSVSGPTDTSHRSVPTKDQILVPETLLKKRKSQEKERSEKAKEREDRKKVSQLHFLVPQHDDDTYDQLD